MRWARFASVFGLCFGMVLAAEPPTFTSKPTAKRDGDKTIISFAVSRETDVTVYIENAKGEVVRHLVAGVLGKNPPAPLKPDSLEQVVEWDGKDDDGKAVEGGQSAVRVGLGLKAAYAGECFAAAGQTGPNSLEAVFGLTAGPDGRTYVLTANQGIYWGSSKLQVFRRDGAYEKTIKPFPADTPVEKAKAAGAFINSFGALNPLNHRIQGLTFYPAEEIAHQPAATADGQLVLAVNNTRLAMLDRDGGIPNPTYAGPALGSGLAYGKYPFLTVASDSKSVYVSGLAPKGQPAHAVYAAKLPDRGPAEAWFGEPGKPGNDNTHLNDVRGLAADGKGHLLVADFGNNRVLALNEKDKSVAGSFVVQAPNWLAVGAKSGAVYVQSSAAVIKFSGWENAREAARLILPPPPGKNQSWRLALDASAEPPVVWAACGSKLMRSEDSGATFTDLAPAGCYPAEFYWRPTADPNRREVLCKIGGTAGYGARLGILEEATGKVRSLGGRDIAGMEGRNHRLGPDGAIYAQDHGFGAGGVLRMDRNGKIVPFEATAKDPYLRGRLPVGTTGTTMWERDFSVDRKGDVYVKARGPEYHGLMSVHVYGPDGKLKRIAAPMVSDGAYGPRVDPQGNLYIMDAIKAPGQLFPEEFNAPLAAFPAARSELDWIYGGVMKFGPPGGAVWFSGSQASPLTYEGWGSGHSISNLRTTGGSLVGTIAKKPATLSLPPMGLETTAYGKLTMRLKNDSDGAHASFIYHTRDEGYIESCGPGKAKTIAIQPNSDSTEYTFELAGEPKWKGAAWIMSLVPTDGTKGSFSIDWVRFGEAGSPLVWNFDAEDGPDKKFPETMKKEKVGAFNRPGGAELQGAQWWRAGFSPLGDMGVKGGCCHCLGSDFDVDDFGRTFAPDTGRFRVGVLDTAGNEILSIGGYGNQDCCGPDSYVLDPAGKFLRPRKADDPKGLTSPFAKPEIAFAWIIGVAVTDKYAYVSDAINKRILRVTLEYAAQATVLLP